MRTDCKGTRVAGVLPCECPGLLHQHIPSPVPRSLHALPQGKGLCRSTLTCVCLGPHPATLARVQAKAPLTMYHGLWDACASEGKPRALPAPDPDAPGKDSRRLWPSVSQSVFGRASNAPVVCRLGRRTARRTNWTAIACNRIFITRPVSEHHCRCRALTGHERALFFLTYRYRY